MYGVAGCLSLCVWNGFDVVSVLLLVATLAVGAAWKSQMVYYKRKENAYDLYTDLERETAAHDLGVHRQSQINVGLEVLGLSISSLCMILAAYRMGDDSSL